MALSQKDRWLPCTEGPISGGFHESIEAPWRQQHHDLTRQRKAWIYHITSSRHGPVRRKFRNLENYVLDLLIIGNNISVDRDCDWGLAALSDGLIVVWLSLPDSQDGIHSTTGQHCQYSTDNNIIFSRSARNCNGCLSCPPTLDHSIIESSNRHLVHNKPSEILRCFFRFTLT